MRCGQPHSTSTPGLQIQDHRTTRLNGEDEVQPLARGSACQPGVGNQPAAVQACTARGLPVAPRAPGAHPQSPQPGRPVGRPGSGAAAAFPPRRHCPPPSPPLCAARLKACGRPAAERRPSAQEWRGRQRPHQTKPRNACEGIATVRARAKADCSPTVRSSQRSWRGRVAAAEATARQGSPPAGYASTRKVAGWLRRFQGCCTANAVPPSNLYLNAIKVYGARDAA